MRLRRCGDCIHKYLKDIRKGGNLACAKNGQDVSPEGRCEEHKYQWEVIRNATATEQRVHKT